MDYADILKRAENMKFKYMFHSKEDEDDFFENIESNKVIDLGNTIYFIRNECGVYEMYFAGESIESVSLGFAKLNDYFEKGKVINVAYAEDKNSEKMMDKVEERFMTSGCEYLYHFIGLKTENLNGDSKTCNGAVKAGNDDVKEIYKVLDASLGVEKEKLDEDAIKNFINSENKNIFLVKENDETAGVILGQVFGREKKMVFVRGVAVDKKYRGRGFSKKLLYALYGWGKSKGAVYSMLWVEKNNDIAINLYNKFGYKPYGDQEINFKYVI